MAAVSEKKLGEEEAVGEEEEGPKFTEDEEHILQYLKEDEPLPAEMLDKIVQPWWTDAPFKYVNHASPCLICSFATQVSILFYARVYMVVLTPDCCHGSSPLSIVMHITSMSAYMFVVSACRICAHYVNS